MKDSQQEQLDILKDMVKLNAIIATELIQLVENSSRQLRGEIPESCRVQHGDLRQQIVEIAEKWNDNCKVLRQHNLAHD